MGRDGKANIDDEVFEYLPPPPSVRAGLMEMSEESARQKFMRKFRSQPLVPIGCLLTTGALSYGMYQMKTGNQFMSQRMMRLRVLAQSFTVVALLAGVVHAAKSRRNESANTNT